LRQSATARSNPPPQQIIYYPVPHQTSSGAAWGVSTIVALGALTGIGVLAEWGARRLHDSSSFASRTATVLGVSKKDRKEAARAIASAGGLFKLIAGKATAVWGK